VPTIAFFGDIDCYGGAPPEGRRWLLLRGIGCFLFKMPYPILDPLFGFLEFI
jgi:hypothetical protein